MESGITLFSVIMLLGAAHGLFLALALVNARGGNPIGHRFLALLTLAFAIDLGHEFLYQTHYLLNVLELAYLDPNINLLYGPSFYLYTCALTEGDRFQFRIKKWLHFLPFVFVMILCALLPSLSVEQFSNLLYDGVVSTSDKDEVIARHVVASVALSSGLLIGIYLILSIHRLIRHTRLIQQQFSSIEQISLNWLKKLFIALSFLYLILFFGGFLSESFGISEEITKLLYLMIVVVIYTMGYLGLRQPVIFSVQSTDKDTETTNLLRETQENEGLLNGSESTKKYQTSALDAGMSTALREELEHHMMDKKPHLDNKLTLGQLAAQLGISANYLSQVINEQFERNFFDFINGHRVEEAKRLLTDPDNAETSILNIALDAGFNSKSAFYTAFKKHTDLTPSQFKKTLLSCSNTA